MGNQDGCMIWMPDQDRHDEWDYNFKRFETFFWVLDLCLVRWNPPTTKNYLDTDQPVVIIFFPIGKEMTIEDGMIR